MIDRDRFVQNWDVDELAAREAYSKGEDLEVLPFMPQTLPDMLKSAVAIGPARGMIFVDQEGNEDRQSYPELLHDAGCVLGALRDAGLKPGDKLVLQVDDDRLFITAFWGAVLGGIVPVPLALPNSFPIAQGAEKVANVCELLEEAFLVTDQSPELYQGIAVQQVFSIRDLLGHVEGTLYHAPSPDDICYLQFSSGSTGDPKGVILTHQNLVSNISAIIRASATAEERQLIEEIFGSPPAPRELHISTCSWLPYSHDMGLIGFHLAPLAASMLQLKMSTTTFVVNPALNILLIDKYRVTQVPSPNFGLLWMLYMVKDEVLSQVDLSCVEVLFNGAEPISPTAVRLFINRFSQYGFNPQAMFPVYGMAEATLMVSAPPVGCDTVYRLLDREAFSREHRARVCVEGGSVIEFVDEGYPCPGMEVRIVDEQDELLTEGMVGHIQIRGPHVTSGYYRREADSHELFCDGWLRTGDLGFLMDSRLTVTGRHKDVIFVNGQNYYSHDIEEEIQQLPFVGFKNMAVCGVMDHEGGSEKIILFLKSRKSREDISELLIKINEALGKRIQVGLDAIVPLKDIPRTTSGKTQRYRLRQRYEAGDFRELEVKRLYRGMRSREEGLMGVMCGQRSPLEARPEARPIDLSEAPAAVSTGDELDMLPYFPKTLLEMIQITCRRAPDKGIIFVDGTGSEVRVNYPEFLADAGRLLAGLRDKGLRAGDRVVLQIEDERHFITCFWGALLGGFVPVPLALPNSFPIAEGTEKVANVCALLERAFLVTDQALELYAALEVEDVLDVRELLAYAEDRAYHEPRPDDLAYIQFSSGSTGFPKGVMLTHHNLICNIYALARATGNADELAYMDRLFSSPTEMADYPISTCSWLPYSHDMGLIGLHLCPLCGGMLQIKMSTTTFVMNPTLYLELIDKYRVTQTASPNFGLLWMFNMVPDAALAGKDLSCIEVLFNGAEPISPTAVRLFCHRFGPYGFNPSAMLPAYGMAEATLMLATSPVGQPSIYHRLDQETFSGRHIAVDASEGAPLVEYADEGYPGLGVSIRIVDDHDQVVKENVVGHIQVRGPNVSAGYYRNDQANRELFCEGWLRTGDLGFIRNGRIVITGRYKDIIFVNGQNYYSHDIEEDLQLQPFVGFKNMAVCGVSDPENSLERIVLFIKTGKSREALLEMLKQINEHLGHKMRLGIDSVVPMDDIPRTTSGKIQRYVLRQRYAAGEFSQREVKRIDRDLRTSEGAYEERAPRPQAPQLSERKLDVRGFTQSYPLAEIQGDQRQPLPRIIRTLPEVLQVACLIAPDSGVLHVDEKGGEKKQTYAEIREGARRVLGALREQGLLPGDQVILQVEDSPAFLCAFWGIVLGGFVPVPLPLPGGFPISEGLERITKVTGVLDRFCIVTDQPREQYRSLGEVRIHAIDELLRHAEDTRHHKPRPDDIAYLQFSSGSTGEPKGVILTHRNLLYTIDASAKSVLDISEADRRPLVGFLLHILRHKLRADRINGLLRRGLERLGRSAAGQLLQGTPRGRTLLETLHILSGNRISGTVDLPIDAIRIVNWMPYSHDMGLIGFHLAPTLGGMDQIKLEPRTFIQSPALFLRLIDRYRATHVPCPNFAAQWLTMQVNPDEIEGIDLSCVKALLNGSEPISAQVTRDFLATFERYGLRREAMALVYGMAEASLQVTCPPSFRAPLFHRLDSELLAREKIVLPVGPEMSGIEIADVGYPVAGLRIRIVDDDDRLLHENMVGHIQIQGPPVVQGYYNNQEANRDLFCAGWLRTGDMGFIRNGRVVITGRMKDVIFVNGQNLYAHDIENNIKRVPGMTFREFAISGLTHRVGEAEKVVLFIKSTEERKVLASLLGRINQALISSVGMAIDFIVPVDEIPRTPSAKIQRFRLRELFECGDVAEIITVNEAEEMLAENASTGKERLSPTELHILRIWSEVLGVDDIHKGDNFFELGGNSLRATKVVSRIREEFACEIPLKAVFEHQSVESLARAVENIKGESVSAKYPPIQPLAPAEHYALSHAQQRLWFLDKVIPDNPLYNLSGAVLLEDFEPDIDMIRQAIQSIVDRHETLRTVFITLEGRPVQVIREHMDVKLDFDDLSDHPHPDEALSGILAAQKRTPFNLAEGPLIRTQMVRLTATRHAFIIVMHHIVSDGWSMGILVREALQSYLALMGGQPPASEGLKIQYKDFAHWQEQLLASAEIAGQEEYWREQLKGRLPVLHLPIDHPRPAIQTQNGGTGRMLIDAATVTRLREFSRAHDVTPFMLTLAAFTVLLQRLSGDEDIIVGSPIAGRNIAEVEELIGFFVNMLPLRIDLVGNPTFSEHLTQVKQTALEAYANQDYPFDKLVEILNPVRDMSRSPVFDVVFEYVELSSSPFSATQTAGFAIRNISGDDPHAKFDLSVNLSEQGDGVMVRFEYNADLFKAESITRMMGMYLNLLQEALVYPEKHVGSLSLLDERERERILKDFNHTRLSVPQDRCVHQIFSETARTHAQRAAVVGRDVFLSYAELEQQSNRLARHLIQQGVRPRDVVGIFTRRGADMILSQLAVWKTGAAFVPIDPHYPTERVRFMLEDAGIQVLLTQNGLRQSLPEWEGTPVCVDILREEIAGLESGPLSVDVDPADRAYIIYTSGSTGRPKGSQITHCNLVNMLTWHDKTFGVGPEDRATQVAGVAFDAMIWELWPYLSVGASVHPLDVSLDEMTPQDLGQWFVDRGITRAFVPTKFAEVFLGLDIPGLVLRTMFTGGDRLSFIPRRQGFDVINCYGPTETTVLVTAGDVSAWERGAPPIGRPIANVRIYILDRHQQVVPVGVPGILYVAGAAVGLGYLNDDAKTAEVFLPDPFGEGRMYCTGDVARWLPDGNIEFIGRRDSQVEIRGHRVEIGEIEYLLASHPRVLECAVIDKRDERENVRLVAFYVGNGALEEEECRAFLREHLPGYMLPSRMIALESLPLTPNGKLDRENLSQLVDENQTGTDYAAPRDELENVLAEVWRAVLNVGQVGIHDNFFDLGGDSIISLQVVSRLSLRGYLIQPRDILQYQTIAELAGVVETSGVIEAEQTPVVGSSPLVPIQRWFFDQGFGVSNQFNQALMFKTTLDLDAGALQQSLNALADHHDALRSTFAAGRQIFGEPGRKVLFITRDVADDTELEGAVHKLQASFDIAAGPVFGAGLFTCGKVNHLVLAAHHLVVDAVSWRIMLEDLLAVYAAVSGGTGIALPPKTTSFKEWATRLEEYAESSTFERELDYWSDTVADGLPTLPVELTDGVNDWASSEVVSVELDEESTAMLLKDAHQAYNTEINDLLVTACMRALMQWSGHNDMVIDLEGHGREDLIAGVDVSRTVGWFTTIFPVRLCWPEGLDLAGQIKSVKEHLRSIPHKGFHYGLLKYVLREDLPINSGVSFNYLGQVNAAGLGDAFELETAQAPGYVGHRNVRPNLIDMVCMVSGGRLLCEVVYSRNRHSRTSVQDLARAFTVELQSVVEHCGDPAHFDLTPSDFDLAGLDQDQLERLISFE